MPDWDWERVPEDSPLRCQGMKPNGQCNNKQVPGSNFCAAHGGNKAQESNNKIKVRQYHLGKFLARAANLSEGNDLKDLKAEIGILRMVLETKLNSCKNETELVVQSAAISDTIMKIQKLVSSCQRLDETMNRVLDESQLMKIADAMVKLISEYIDNPDTLNDIADRLSMEIAQIATTASN